MASWVWKCAYEQCGINGLRVYKFDHTPIADGAWHPLSATSTASYRIQDAYAQVVIPGAGLTEHELTRMLARFEAAGPLDTDDALEIVIRWNGTKYDMWARYIYQDEGVQFSDFSSRSLNDAYARLKRLHAQLRSD